MQFSLGMLILDNVLPCFYLSERRKALYVSYIYEIYICVSVCVCVFMLYIFYIKVQVWTVFENGALVTIAIVNCTLTELATGHIELST